MKVLVTAFPYATQYGTIDIPDELMGDASDEREYVRNHWNDIEFEEPELDYSGTDFELDE